MGSKNFALIGFPLGHSLSPQLHQKLMQAAGVNGSYRLLETPPEALSAFCQTQQTLDGYNVTIPHKTAIIPFLDAMSDKAALFGAVNTVCREHGGYKGYNTDCEGFLRALDGAGITLGGRVLVLGSGGVSRMFAFESALAGAEVSIAARNPESAGKLQGEIREKLATDCAVMPLDGVKGDWDLIINGTPVGMFPKTDASPLRREAVQCTGAVFDAIYNPRQTLLLRDAAAAGIPAVNGLAMLVWQAAVAQEIWNGVTLSKDAVQTIIREMQEETHE